MATVGEVLTVSDTLEIHPFRVDEPKEPGPQDKRTGGREDAIRARLADGVRQEEKRRRLAEFLKRETPAWNPADHPEIEAAGGAAAWVKKLRSEAEQGFKRGTRS